MSMKGATAGIYIDKKQNQRNQCYAQITQAITPSKNTAPRKI